MSHLKIITALWTTKTQRQPADISSVYAGHKNSAVQKTYLAMLFLMAWRMWMSKTRD